MFGGAVHVRAGFDGKMAEVNRTGRTMAVGHVAAARILIADEQPIFRDGLKRLLETESDLHVVGEAGNAMTTLQLVRQLDPDLLLLDLAMPDGAGLDVLRALAAVSRLPRTIVLTAGIGQDQLILALRLGVRGVVLKESTTQSLCESIRMVLKDQY